MTRINASIKPAELSDSMLFAEYREIKRIPNKLKANKYSEKSPIPESFRLNSGHELFFKDKILYLEKRSRILYKECVRRGINVQDYSQCYQGVPDQYYNDWIETPESRELLKERINLRLKNSKAIIRFNKQIVSIEKALIK